MFFSLLFSLSKNNDYSAFVLIFTSLFKSLRHWSSQSVSRRQLDFHSFHCPCPQSQLYHLFSCCAIESHSLCGFCIPCTSQDNIHFIDFQRPRAQMHHTPSRIIVQPGHSKPFLFVQKCQVNLPHFCWKRVSSLKSPSNHFVVSEGITVCQIISFVWSHKSIKWFPGKQ